MDEPSSQYHPITDQQWATAVRIMITQPTSATHAGQIRQAIDALLWMDHQHRADTGELPPWVQDPAACRAIHHSWALDGTAIRMRKLLSQAAHPWIPPPPNIPTSPKTTYAVQTTTEIVRYFEKSVAFHYANASFSQDQTDDTSLRSLPALQNTLELMYDNWEAENNRPWPHRQILDPNPGNDWITRTSRSLAITIVTQILRSASDELERAVDQVQDVTIRATPYHAHDWDPHDRNVRIAALDAKKDLDNLRHSVDRLQLHALSDLHKARAQEARSARFFPDYTWPIDANNPPAPTATPVPTTLDHKIQSAVIRGGRPPKRNVYIPYSRRQVKPPGQQSYEQLAIEWAQSHDNLVWPRELAHSIIDSGAIPPSQLNRLTNSIGAAVRKSKSFVPSGHGIHRYTPPEPTQQES